MISEEFIKAVTERNIDDIRSFLSSSISFDRTLTNQFQELWNYCLEQGIREEDIYQEPDSKHLDSEITPENFNKIRGSLLTQFSRERIEALKRLGSALYGNHKNSRGAVEESHLHNQTENSDETKHPSMGAEIAIGIGAAILAGAVFGLGFKLAIWKTIGGAVGIGAAASIGTRLYKLSKK